LLGFGLFAVALVLACALLSAPTATAAPSFPDVSASHPYADAIADLSGRGIISGYGSGDFGPENPVTRQQFAKMIVLAAGYPVSESDLCGFVDVQVSGPGSLYPDNYVSVAAARDITRGTDGHMVAGHYVPGTHFAPDKNITRLQVITMVVRTAQNLQPSLLALPPAGWNGNAAWAADATHGVNARIAEYNGLLGGLDLDGLTPAGTMTRGEVAQVLHNLLGKLGEGNATATKAVSYLTSVMDQFHDAFDIYSDADAAGNHFAARGRMASVAGAETVPAMNEAWTTSPHSGLTCIKATFAPQGANWGGWYFMNGVLVGTERQPRENWGSYSNAGIDLRGASRLTFWARGARGGERVEFFAGNLGRNESGTPVEPYPDSASKLSTGYVTLTSSWKQYTISLEGKDLSYVIGGFGWVTNARENAGTSVTFYLDDIAYDRARLPEPRFLLSYQTVNSGKDVDTVLRNVAFTYDNAVALMAFLASGRPERAKLIADALLYALDNDRAFADGRVRNAYQAGDLVLPAGWAPNAKTGTVRMPGWFDREANPPTWYEDSVQVGTSTGNQAWAMLALLAYYETEGGAQYLAAAERMGDWVEDNCRDSRGAGGYTAGCEGWETGPQVKLSYKATEHNIDLYAAFGRLYLLTGKQKWQGRAEHAQAFLRAMWDATEGRFSTGTREDGTTINTDVVPLDVQVWAHLALGAEAEPYRASLAYAETHCALGQGFDFNEDRDGIWYEGTAQMATAYGVDGQEAAWQSRIDLLQQAQDPSGGIVATNVDELTTGFQLSDGSSWLYYKRLHVGATAWLALAQMKVNPFWLGHGEN
jgi:hypothetical protein